ncbi:MAG: Rdx family protein [Chloroflexi bacterium]|nr:Rdx family protein [Chloroflexota bacterium]MBU1746967.1 Rdx family protein [Chloroflexota bacterium]
MADELRQAFGAESRMIAGQGGVFDVTVDGKLVFSKFQTGRFPEPGEIVQLLE